MSGVEDSMYNFHGNNSTHLMMQGLAKVLKQYSISPRGMVTRELTFVTLQNANPDQRVICTPYRNNNVFATIAETLWTLAGRNDLNWLANYLPRVYDFSDNGTTWRGAYGPRLRNYSGANFTVDQLDAVVGRLNRDMYTRRAVISLFDPSEDNVETLDVPCNNWLQFVIRDGKLHMAVAQRSSDIIWGYSGIDTFLWSTLQEMIGFWVTCLPGQMTHFITSWHMYELHYEKAQAILKHGKDSIHAIFGPEFKTPHFTTSLDEFDLTLQQMFVYEKAMRILQSPEALWELWLEMQNTIDDALLQTYLKMLFIYWVDKFYSSADALSYIGLMDFSEYKVAALEYLLRNGLKPGVTMNDVKLFAKLQDNEMAALRLVLKPEETVVEVS